jgi:type I restriction enzyme, S subunit
MNADYRTTKGQHRMVAKVDVLMMLCDRLEASITAARATRRHLDILLTEVVVPMEAGELQATE